jgi:hypothetical protein
VSESCRLRQRAGGYLRGDRRRGVLVLPARSRAKTVFPLRSLASGANPRLVKRAARLLQGYEKLYWDTLHALSGA